MATFATASADVALLTVNLPGLSRGRIATRPPPNGATTLHTTQPAIGAWWTVGAGRAPAAPVNQGGTQLTRDLSIGRDWFDLIHILPRTQIDFGNIVSTATSPFQIFNGFNQNVDFTLFVNNAGVGVDIPNLPVPTATIGPFNTILDPASVRMAPVRLDVEASIDGPPSFDSTLEFTFSPGGTVVLAVKGSRVAFFFAPFDGEVDETLEWNTDVQAIADGHEQRVSNRRNPRQSFDGEVIADAGTRRRLQSQLFGWHGRTFGLPLRHETILLSAAVLVGATTATFTSTAGIDLRVGGLCVLFKDESTYDVLYVDSFTATTVTFVSGTQFAYAVGDSFMPVRIARLSNDTDVLRYLVNGERVKTRFDVIDNDTGAPTGSFGSYATHLTRAIIDPTVVDGEGAREGHQMRVTVIDSETGIVSHSAHWDMAKATFTVGFAGKTLAEVYAIRRLLYALRGRQVTFVSPTFIEDLVVTQNLASAGTTMVVANCSYSRFVDARQPRATFRIRFNDGTSLIRTILSAVETSITEETLTLNAAWPANRNVSEIRDVQFLRTARLANDRVRIRHLGVGRARVAAPATVVFDTP